MADVSDPGQVAAFAEKVSARHATLGALVNSAGIQRYGTVETTSPETWDEVFAVNVRSMFLLAKHVLPLMRRNGGGAIVNVSSGTGRGQPAQRGGVHRQQGRDQRHDASHGG